MSTADKLLDEYYDRNGIGKLNSGFLNPWETELDAYMRAKRGTQLHTMGTGCNTCRGYCVRALVPEEKP